MAKARAKRCLSCKRIRPIDCFAKHWQAKDGREKNCRDCRNSKGEKIAEILSASQVDGFLRGMAEVQVAIDSEKAICEQKVAAIQKHHDETISSWESKKKALDKELATCRTASDVDGYLRKAGELDTAISHSKGVFEHEIAVIQEQHDEAIGTWQADQDAVRDILKGYVKGVCKGEVPGDFKKCRFGSIAKEKGEVVITLNTKLTAERRGRP